MKQTIEIDVPDGYELIRDNKFEALKNEEICEERIIFKKSQFKNWIWYVDEYCFTELKKNNINHYIEIHGNLMLNEFDKVLLEFKIGLFIFICNDFCIMTDFWLSVLYCHRFESRPWDEGLNIIFKKIKQLCPEDFLNSLYDIYQKKVK
jgi:hypothetical protein